MMLQVDQGPSGSRREMWGRFPVKRYKPLVMMAPSLLTFLLLRFTESEVMIHGEIGPVHYDILNNVKFDRNKELRRPFAYRYRTKYV